MGGDLTAAKSGSAGEGANGELFCGVKKNKYLMDRHQFRFIFHKLCAECCVIK